MEMYVLPDRKCPVATIPRCDMPSCDGESVVDAPTRMGPWANLCFPHAARVGIPRMGTALVLAPPVEDEPVVVEALSCEGCWEVGVEECPDCGCPVCESDALKGR